MLGLKLNHVSKRGQRCQVWEVLLSLSHFCFSLFQEHEQSEYERREKEHERLNAHESIVEREIRLQREREIELERQRVLMRAGDELLTAPSPVNSAVYTEETLDLPPSAASSIHSSYFDSQPLAAPSTARSSMATPSEAEPVGYEDAISTYAHRGESLIAKELREQREREAELHSRWQEMGVESLIDPRDKPDTPFNRPEPAQPQFQPKTANRLSAAANTSSIRKFSAPPDMQRFSSPEPPAEVKSERSKVSTQPWLHEVEEEAGVRYAPASETPIEREIRLSREREQELRQQKRLPEPTTENKSKEIMLEVKGEPRRPSWRSEQSDHATMKRLAESRLHQELQQEKQRELALQREGKISSTSEQHQSPAQRYKDLIPKDSPTYVPSPMKSQPAPLKPQTTPQVRSQPPAMRAPLTPTQNFRTPVQDKTVNAEPRKPVVPNGVPGSGPPRSTSEPNSIVMRTNMDHTADKTANRKSTNIVESKIEREMREMREREEELRWDFMSLLNARLRWLKCVNNKVTTVLCKTSICLSMQMISF